jgi:hypothetical protein
MAKDTITHPDRELDLTVETDSGPADASAMVAEGVADILLRVGRVGRRLGSYTVFIQERR